MMTKQETINTAKNAAEKYFAAGPFQDVEVWIDYLESATQPLAEFKIANEWRAQIALDTLRSSGTTGVTGPLFLETFLNTLASLARSAWSELPEVVAERKAKWFDRLIANTIDEANSTLEQFKTRLADDPAYAFEWGDKAILAAAKLNVGLRAKASLAGVDSRRPDVTWEPRTREEILTALTRNVLELARSSSHSTSACSNLMEDAKRVAMAEFIDRAGEI